MATTSAPTYEQQAGLLSAQVKATVKLAGENLRLLAKLQQYAVTNERTVEYFCLECGEHAFTRGTVRHLPGCILWSQDPALLAQLDAFEIADGEVV